MVLLGVHSQDLRVRGRSGQELREEAGPRGPRRVPRAAGGFSELTSPAACPPGSPTLRRPPPSASAAPSRPQQPLLSEAFLSPDVLRHRLCERPRGHALQSQCSAESLGDSVVLPTPAAGSSVRSGLGTAPPAPVSVCACAPPLPLPRTQALSISHQEARRYRDDTWGSLKGQKAKGGISQSKYSKWKRKTCAQPPR